MKISVITATWNSGKTIEDTLKSVLRQTYTDVEHIIKDGGSKDETVEICEEYRRKFYSTAESLKLKAESGGEERARLVVSDDESLELKAESGGKERAFKTMKILSDKDKGIYDAMNQGIEAATGDVIGILNSDDFYTSDDVLEIVSKEFRKNSSLEALYGDIHFVSADATLANPGKCTRYYSSAMFRPWLLRFGFMPAHPSFYVRREVYEKYGLYDLDFRTSSDYEMMVRLFHKYHIKAKYINKDFVTMRAGGESTAGIEAKRKVNNDIVRSLKKHGIFTLDAFKYIRYGYKSFELLINKIRY